MSVNQESSCVEMSGPCRAHPHELVAAAMFDIWSQIGSRCMNSAQCQHVRDKLYPVCFQLPGTGTTHWSNLLGAFS